VTPRARNALLAILTPALAVALAGLYALIQRGGTRELPAFFAWSLPLAAPIAVFTRRPRFLRAIPVLRIALTALAGLLIGVGWTVCGWLVMDGWMLAWDLPVLHCWAIAGATGTLVASIANGAVSPRGASLGLGLTLLPLGAVWWYASQPWPAVLIVYRDQPTFDAAQTVLDSVLTTPHPSGEGRDIKWAARSYLRTQTSTGETAALIALQHARDRESIRAALAGNPLVVRVIDTVMSH
jgi:hypothetical protein